MAADQRRKRFNGATIVGCSSREQLHKAKKKNVGSIQDESNINSHISLEWDGDQKAVVAKRDQIGISWRDMRPYIDPTFTSNNIPADIFVVPHGIYELENLDDVLTYEVWQTHLSENERIHLMQFLPRGPETQQIVQALLTGDTFHFGNPFLKWGASLCSGDFHPDLILCQEQSLKTEKNIYYKELQKYHNDLIAYLLNLKERYAGCEDPEKDFLPEIWSLQNGMEKQINSNANDSRFGVFDENATLTSESCSWVADEKACSSDNQFSSAIKGGELENSQNRICVNGFRKDKSRQSVTADDSLNVAVASKKGDKLQKLNNIHSSDGAKYMSYVKISKKQYELVKSMKQSGKSVHCRSLNRVLGQGFNVQPYQVFVEEEQKKLYEHWFLLASQDLPAAYASWKEMRLLRRKITESLETDMRKRLTSVMEDEGKDNHSALEDELLMDNPESTMQDDEKSIPHSPQGENCNLIYMEGDVMSQPLTNGHECNFTDIDSEKNITIESDNDLEKDIITESDHYPPIVSEYLGNLNTKDAALSQGAHLCSSGDAWKAVNMPHSYYDSTVSHDYPSVSEFSVTPPDNEEHQTQMIDLANGFHVGDMGKDMSHRQSENGSFNSYPSQDRNELLQSLFKGQGMSSYPLQKQNGLDFRTPNNMFMGDGRFPVHFEEHQHQPLPMELGEMRENDDYMQQLPENVSDGGGYLIPRQENLAPVNLQDWANSVRMPGPPQSQFNGGDMLSQNWFSGEQPVHAGWSASGATITSHSIGTESTADQGLFGVLSHCNQLRSGNHYHSVESIDQFSLPRGYGMVGGVTPRVGNVLPQAAHTLDYLGSCDAAASIIHDDMQWMNLSHQTSGLRDPMGKPFLRSWNQ